MPFYNRADEIAALEERWRSPRGEYVLVYGRRRIGKTELILQFAEAKRSLYFEATTGTETDHLEDASRLLADVTGRELFAAQPLTSWEAFFVAVGEELARGPLLVALDEFQFVARQSPNVGSYINRFWRAHKDDPNLFLILSGSDVSFFERDLMGYAATTYGRRTGSLRLGPFSYRELAHFAGAWSSQDLIRAFAAFGGVPYYLEALDDSKSLAENLARVILTPDGLLREEPRFLFAQHSDLRDEAVYFSILRAIAAGRTRRNEIADRIKRSSDATGQLLEKLIDMRLVRRVHPVTVRNPERSKTVRFAIDDPFLRFWFAFVHPYESRLHDRGGGRRHLDGTVLPQLDAFVSAPAFEEICQAWLTRQLDAAVGWWWGNVKERTPDGPRTVRREVDVVAVDDQGSVIALGSCKWTDGPLPASEKMFLRRLAPHVGVSDTEPDLYFFSRSGFEPAIVHEAKADPKCHLIDVDELFRAS
jgi:AAA+ ATPase superfamily predicted ATPase